MFFFPKKSKEIFWQLRFSKKLSAEFFDVIISYADNHYVNLFDVDFSPNTLPKTGKNLGSSAEDEKELQRYLNNFIICSYIPLDPTELDFAINRQFAFTILLLKDFDFANKKPFHSFFE